MILVILIILIILYEIRIAVLLIMYFHILDSKQSEDANGFTMFFFVKTFFWGRTTGSKVSFLSKVQFEIMSIIDNILI